MISRKGFFLLESIDAIDSLPSFLKALGLLGPKTAEATRYLLLPIQPSLFKTESLASNDDDALDGFVRSLIDPNAKWSDDEAASLLHALSERKSHGDLIDFSAVTRWVNNHPNDAASIIQCVDVDPPDEVDIIRVLSQSGSQKVVYLASWRSMQREVVVKKIIRTDESAAREMESFPLNLSHPNIIETHPLRNKKGEVFFAELRLAEVLDDRWQAAGIQDGSNLLFDIASALKYLHDHKRVHGDVKPDNIGKDAGEFILLDFGICRPTGEFANELTATGSLRTRAPELLLNEGYVDPPKVDVWALGATIFNAYCGRFPLTSCGERVPRVSEPVAREEFESLLATRAREWNQWVEFSKLPEELRSIVAAMLEPRPAARISSSNVIDRATKELPALIRGLNSDPSRRQRFSPLEELHQIGEFMGHTRLKLIPRRKTAEMIARLRDLQGTPGFSKKEQDATRQLLTDLDKVPGDEHKAD